MVNVAAALKEIDVDPRRGVVRAVQTVGENIAESTDPLGYANAVIQSLGGQEQLDFPTARIMAKSLVEQAVSGDKFDPKTALKAAEQKVAKLRTEQAWSFTGTAAPTADGETPVVQKGRKSAVLSDGKSKKAAALKLCADNASLDNGALASLIAKELAITYANAYYYVSRVWKRPN